EYIDREEALERFGDKARDVTSFKGGANSTFGSFYFLPENFNIIRNDLMFVSYVWYKSKRKKKRLYSRKRNQVFDFAGGDENLRQVLSAMPGLEVVEVTVPTFKLCVVLNNKLMFNGYNPLGFDECPFVMIPWNYEPHNNQPNLR